MTPAPLAGAFYAPPYAGGYLMNPYFPATGYPAYPGAPIGVPPGAAPAPLPPTVVPGPGHVHPAPGTAPGIPNPIR